MGAPIKIEKLKANIEQLAKEYELKKVSLFGSYADGKQTSRSDIDLLVEFNEETVSLFTIFGLQHELQKRIKKKVDIIQAPLSQNSFIEIGKEVLLYG